MQTKHTVIATSFADPKDVEKFREAKARGLSDQEAFKYGDNGIGKWGHVTAQDKIPMVALPPEDWMTADKSGGSKVRVTRGNRCVVAILGDTMPHKANIKNGAGIDLNPAATRALGLCPPVDETVTWEWAD